MAIKTNKMIKLLKNTAMMITNQIVMNMVVYINGKK